MFRGTTPLRLTNNTKRPRATCIGWFDTLMWSPTIIADITEPGATLPLLLSLIKSPRRANRFSFFIPFFVSSFPPFLLLALSWDVPLLGVVPDEPFLARPSLIDLEKIFKTKLLAGLENRRQPHYSIKHTLMAATGTHVWCVWCRVMLVLATWSPQSHGFCCTGKARSDWVGVSVKCFPRMQRAARCATPRRPNFSDGVGPLCPNSVPPNPRHER